VNHEVLCCAEKVSVTVVRCGVVCERERYTLGAYPASDEMVITLPEFLSIILGKKTLANLE